MTTTSPAVLELKARVAGALVRSKLDYTDDILILNAFLRDFRWEDGGTPERMREKWESLRESPPPEPHLFSVYIHMPYCRSKCHYCYCSSKVAVSRAQLDAYVPELLEEIRFFSPAVAGLPVRLFQMGGGTPSLLSAGQLAEILSCAVDHFDIVPDGIKSIEFNPASTDGEKLAAARRHGHFNRISLGVQSMNPRALKTVNREQQTFEQVREAALGARDAGFEAVNLDLILNLAGDDLAGLEDSVRRAASLRPTSLTVAGLSMTDHYLKVMGLTREDNLRDYRAYLPAALDVLRRVAAEQGYETDGLSPTQGNWIMFDRQAPRDLLRRLGRADHFAGGNCSILGLGQYSRSHAFAGAFYERLPKPFAPGAPLYRHVPYTLKDEMAAYILYALENFSRVEDGLFRERFGTELRRAFALELQALSSLEKIRFDDKGFDFLASRGPQRIFYGAFFLLENLARSPFGAGNIDAAFLARLRLELEAPPAAA